MLQPWAWLDTVPIIESLVSERSIKVSEQQLTAIRKQMRSLAHTLIFYGDSKEVTKRRKSESAYWQHKIDTAKADMMALIMRLIPNYTGTVEEYVAANVAWLV